MLSQAGETDEDETPFYDVASEFHIDPASIRDSYRSRGPVDEDEESLPESLRRPLPSQKGPPSKIWSARQQASCSPLLFLFWQR